MDEDARHFRGESGVWQRFATKMGHCLHRIFTLYPTVPRQEPRSLLPQPGNGAGWVRLFCREGGFLPFVCTAVLSIGAETVGSPEDELGIAGIDGPRGPQPTRISVARLGAMRRPRRVESHGSPPGLGE